MVFVTGSHIRQRVDPATGGVRTTSPIRIYSREQLEGPVYARLPPDLLRDLLSEFCQPAAGHWLP
jgi:hypothetical protein